MIEADALKNPVASASAALGGASEITNAAGTEPPRFDLFHAANSICSQKVRCVLAQDHFPYSSRQVNLFLGQTYLPDYAPADGWLQSLRWRARVPS
jgi:2,5-dichlorohydroquinone reductive dechlorinase